MTETRRPKPCHYDRTLGHRIITREHRDDCTNPGDHPGCAPCTAHHCVICTRRHLDNDHPLTCTECVGQVRDDLNEILWLCRHLRWQAARAGRDGRLAAAAPIPGGDAMVVLARAGAIYEDMRVARGYTTDEMDKDHHARDVVPALIPLAAWDTRIREHYGHRTATRAKHRDHYLREHYGQDVPVLPTISGIVDYLRDRLTNLAQDTTGGVDWLGFTRDMAALRRQLEGVMHDEREPERGVSCFECGDHLVRRFGKPNPCAHRTPARARLDQIQADAAAARDRLAVLATYPELGPPTYADQRAARRIPSAAEESAARVPCSACTNQGGIEDPSVGQSWECQGCRKKYTPGEYGHAVRRDLLEGGPDGDGWTHIGMAAEAASTQTGILFPANTVRRWMDRGKVGAMCRWTPGTTWGLRLVFWPDVAEEAARAVTRAYEAEQARALRARQRVQLGEAIAAGEDPKVAGERLGIHPARVPVLIDELDREQTQESA